MGSDPYSDKIILTPVKFVLVHTNAALLGVPLFQSGGNEN